MEVFLLWIAMEERVCAKDTVATLLDEISCLSNYVVLQWIDNPNKHAVHDTKEGTIPCSTNVWF